MKKQTYLPLERRIQIITGQAKDLYESVSRNVAMQLDGDRFVSTIKSQLLNMRSQGLDMAVELAEAVAATNIGTEAKRVVAQLAIDLRAAKGTQPAREGYFCPFCEEPITRHRSTNYGEYSARFCDKAPRNEASFVHPQLLQTIIQSLSPPQIVYDSKVLDGESFHVELRTPLTYTCASGNSITVTGDEPDAHGNAPVAWNAHPSLEDMEEFEEKGKHILNALFNEVKEKVYDHT